MEQHTEPQPPLQLTTKDVLQEILREGARRLLREAIEAEIQNYVAAHTDQKDSDGRRLVVRNGYLPAREIQTGLGPLEIHQPRVDDRRKDPDGNRLRFHSEILPPYLRRTKSVEELIPWLYLRGISTGDFAEALAALLGPGAAGLSATNIVRLKASWEQEWKTWSHQSLAAKRYVYLWADGVYFNIRLEEEGNRRQCILVLMGATEEGRKELIAITEGYRESQQSWKELLLDAQSRGLTIAPHVAVADGALGFWSALREVFPTTREQRCWVHKMANVLDKLPKHIQTKAKAMLQEIWMAATKKAAQKAFGLFVETFGSKYPKAVECLQKDQQELLTFYDFPAEHWVHLRTSNPIESMFSTVRLRTARTKGCGSRTACLTMVFKLAQCAQSHWRRLNGSALLLDIIQGVPFVDGIRSDTQEIAA